MAVALQACGGDTDCKAACERLEECGFSSSGFSCDAKCNEPDATCAACVNDEDVTCGLLRAECSTQCSGKAFRELDDR